MPSNAGLVLEDEEEHEVEKGREHEEGHEAWKGHECEEEHEAWKGHEREHESALLPSPATPSSLRPPGRGAGPHR